MGGKRKSRDTLLPVTSSFIANPISFKIKTVSATVDVTPTLSGELSFEGEAMLDVAITWCVYVIFY